MQTLEPTVFSFLILGKFRFPPKKLYNINYSQKKLKTQGHCYSYFLWNLFQRSIPFNAEIKRYMSLLAKRRDWILINCIITFDSLKSFKASDVEPVWPDLAKFHHSGTMSKNFGLFKRVDLIFGKILSFLWQILNSIGQIIIVENGQILNKQSCRLVTLRRTYRFCKWKVTLGH